MNYRLMLQIWILAYKKNCAYNHLFHPILGAQRAGRNSWESCKVKPWQGEKIWRRSNVSKPIHVTRMLEGFKYIVLGQSDIEIR